MDIYFAYDYPGEPFILFGKAHLFSIVIVGLVILWIIWFRNHSTPKSRARARYILAAILLVNEIGWHAWHLAWGRWNIQEMLPLHMCSVMVWTSILMLYTRNGKLQEFAYFLGIGGATQALLTPDAGIYGFPHFRFFQTMIAHGGIVIAALYMTLVEGFRPTLKSVKNVIIWTNVYMVIVFIINQLIGSNYMFIAHKPETASLIDLLGPWPWYILAMEAIGLVLVFILYLPYAYKDWATQRIQT
ncbi:MAG: TIGR02206 family membrane protein [Anaerolineales bacterium]